MKKFRYIWAVGLLATLAIILTPILIFYPKGTDAKEDPWTNIPKRRAHVDHTDLIKGPFENGSQVTEACMECHEEEAFDVMQSVHFTWESEPYQFEGRPEPVTVGKKNTPNNFCLGIQSNWPGCTSCHAGYGWEDANFDFKNPENIDCLVCHDTSGTYVKGESGQPVEGVDLLSVAQSVGFPNRRNCGGCHFQGGGGNGVKHGDLDEHLAYPSENVDIHMGKHDFVCTDCHKTDEHTISGKALSVNLEMSNQIFCTDCHEQEPHEDGRLNDHTSSVACQTCHIPTGAVKDPTKMYWDWSTAGQDREEDLHEYLKIKGSFVYESDFIPEYLWYSGIKDRYLFGDKIDPNQVTVMNPPAGDINDPEAKIFPFKIHRARQPYDKVYNYLLQPKTFGEEGFWTEFDWDKSLRLGSEAVGMEYSGQYGFAPTEMYWPITHMVPPAEEALQCNQCHGTDSRLDWLALGYPGDPINWGGRFQNTP